MRVTWETIAANGARWHSIQNSGRPYAVFIRIGEECQCIGIDIVETPNSSFDELPPIPEVADLVYFSGPGIIYYLGGTFFSGDQVAKINDPNEPTLVQEFHARGSWAVVRIRNGRHYMLLSRSSRYIPLSQDGQPDLSRIIQLHQT